MPQLCKAPIGVFDSGVGGLTVVRALKRILPDERLIYLGDTARVPYGTKSRDTVANYVKQIAAFLLARRCKSLVIACNTASAHALSSLRDSTDVPVCGVIEPGAQEALARGHRHFGVLATIGTVASGAYDRALTSLAAEATVVSQACPLFVPLAEEGWATHPITAQVADVYLSEIAARAPNTEALILGCTHYPLLHDVIAGAAERAFGAPVDVVDSAVATAKAVAAQLRENKLAATSRSGEDAFLFTDVGRYDELVPRFLGGNPSCELVDLVPPVATSGS